MRFQDSNPAPAYKAISKLYNALMTGLVLTLVTQKDTETARAFVFGHFRRQHTEKFLPGLKKLGLEGLPDAVACAQYHYFSNALGGVTTEYVPETDKKAWVRYPPPRWIWSGTAICGVPQVVNEAMLHGWHGHNGVSLGNPRLGFVCTGQTVAGDPGLEGYYCEYDRELTEAERVRFAPDERPPAFDPDKQPVLASADWPAERLAKIERSYATEYVRSFLPTLAEITGPDDAAKLIGRTARLIGLQYYAETAESLGISDKSANAFMTALARLCAAQGESVAALSENGLKLAGWRLLDGVPVDHAYAVEALLPLWQGMAAVHNRDLSLHAHYTEDGLTFHW